jgi:hypothetical protein
MEGFALSKPVPEASTQKTMGMRECPSLSHDITPENRCGIFNFGTPELEMPPTLYFLSLSQSPHLRGKIPCIFECFRYVCPEETSRHD